MTLSPAFTLEQARDLDAKCAQRSLRHEFHIPTKDEVHSNVLPDSESTASSRDSECIYLVGNSLGPQPKRTAPRIAQHLATWRTQGVQGHFKKLDKSLLPRWLDTDETAARLMAPILGADVSEVAVMQTLTANLHFLMSAFYKPDANGRRKIILEDKAFPSDYFAVESQIRNRELSPELSMVLISPVDSSGLLSTAHILSVIEKHADSTALLLLPGIQYYSGEMLDIPKITKFAHKHGIFVIWDLAHAAGNVPLRLHDWDVDAAVFCTYKYLNSGPGSIGGLFVHTRLTDPSNEKSPTSLTGWWGDKKSTRFLMDNQWRRAPGAVSFQVSNPSVFDMTSLCASLEVFSEAGGIETLRQRSLQLTNYLETLLMEAVPEPVRALFTILTPSDPQRRGAQLSILLQPGLLQGVMASLEEAGILVDERQPDVIRVAPAPLYNTFEDCFRFVRVLVASLAKLPLDV